MARSKITAISTDLISDSGSVLWSVIQGEQLEFPLVLDFVDNVRDTNLEFEAVIVEGLNDGIGTKPTMVAETPVLTTLPIRFPAYLGLWDANEAYSLGEIVNFEGEYYERVAGINVTSAVTPVDSADWQSSNLQTLYVQLPATLSVSPAWAIPPTVGAPVYGFFELRVTELNHATYARTWKPIRGMLEIFFSPTALVPDI
jgi:hypothetical protein